MSVGVLKRPRMAVCRSCQEDGMGIHTHIGPERTFDIVG